MIVYTDGSFNKKVTRAAAGYAAVLVKSETPDTYIVDIYFGVVTDPEFTKMWNVGGEIMAAIIGAEAARDDYHADKIDLHHDYLGISTWPQKKWKANNAVTAGYASRMQKLAEDVPVHYWHVKGHSGETLNELADEYAKLGITRYIEEGDISCRRLDLFIPKRKMKETVDGRLYVPK